MIGWLLLAAGGSGFNQTFIQGLADCRPFEQALLELLPETLVVFPTENYYYFHVSHCGEEYRGNLNFSIFYPEPEVRLVYYPLSNLSLMGETFNPEDSTVIHTFTPSSGLKFTKLSQHLYRITLPIFPQPLLVRFVEIPQTPPPLPDPERFEFIFRTMDESGLMFVLTYDREDEDFVWFLSDTQFVPVHLQQVGDDPIFVHERSGFVFVKTGPALMLVGVPELNEVQNNWYDGPFDQLNDRQWNPVLSKIIQAHAKQHWLGDVDSLGFYPDKEGRFAISGYLSFISIDDLLPPIQTCLKTRSERISLRCIRSAFHGGKGEQTHQQGGTP